MSSVERLRNALWASALGAGLVVTAAACSSEQALENCIPGSRVACECGDGSRGLRVCGPDGKSRSECGACGQGSGGEGGAATGGSGGCAELATWLDYHVIDADYSSALDRLVMVSDSPPALHVYDARSNSEQTATLALPPESLSVAPDGLTAAVGHDGRVSIVDLSGPSVVVVHPLPATLGDVVLAGDGWLYAFPATTPTIHSMDVLTGDLGPSSAATLNSGRQTRLHPAGDKIYGVGGPLYSTELERYDIDQGNVEITRYANPYVYSTCGELWLSQDGRRIFTRCGEVFISSDDPAQDMQHDATLDVYQVRSLWHTPSRGEVALLPAREPTDHNKLTPISLRLFDDEFLTEKGSLELPCLDVDALVLTPAGVYVFGSASGDYVVILEGDDTLLTEGRFAVATVAAP